MTHIGYFILASKITNIVYLRRSIILSKLPKTKVKEFLGILSFIGVEGDMLPTVLADSIVPEPYVIAQSSIIECC
jgi:hypothetical protein